MKDPKAVRLSYIRMSQRGIRFCSPGNASIRIWYPVSLFTAFRAAANLPESTKTREVTSIGKTISINIGLRSMTESPRCSVKSDWRDS